MNDNSSPATTQAPKSRANTNKNKKGRSRTIKPVPFLLKAFLFITLKQGRADRSMANRPASTTLWQVQHTTRPRFYLNKGALKPGSCRHCRRHGIRTRWRANRTETEPGGLRVECPRLLLSKIWLNAILMPIPACVPRACWLLRFYSVRTRSRSLECSEILWKGQ